MIINRVLDEVFCRWSNIAVLRALQRFGMGISGREVSRAAGITVKNCFTALTDLENLGIVTRVRGGRDHLFSLNWEHVLVTDALVPLFKVEDEYFDKLTSFIKSKLKKHSISLIVFGSVARKEETIKSDLDLCIVVADAKQKTAAEDTVFDMSADVNRKYGASLSAIYFTRKEFIQRASKNKQPVNNIAKEGKVIGGLSIRELING